MEPKNGKIPTDYEFEMLSKSGSSTTQTTGGMFEDRTVTVSSCKWCGNRVVRLLYYLFLRDLGRIRMVSSWTLLMVRSRWRNSCRALAIYTHHKAP